MIVVCGNANEFCLTETINLSESKSYFKWTLINGSVKYLTHVHFFCNFYLFENYASIPSK